MEQERQNQLLGTLERRDAYEALRQVVLAWKASGMSQQAALEVLEELRVVLRSRGEQEQNEDLVLEVMDCISGFCAPQQRLF